MKIEGSENESDPSHESVWSKKGTFQEEASFLESNQNVMLRNK